MKRATEIMTKSEATELAKILKQAKKETGIVGTIKIKSKAQ